MGSSDTSPPQSLEGVGDMRRRFFGTIKEEALAARARGKETRSASEEGEVDSGIPLENEFFNKSACAFRMRGLVKNSTVPPEEVMSKLE